MAFNINNFTVKYCGKKKPMTDACKLPITIQEKEAKNVFLFPDVTLRQTK